MTNHAFVYERNRPKAQQSVQKRDPLLDVNQTANRLNVSRATIYRLINSGELPASRLGTAHCIRIKESDIEAFRQERDALDF